MLDELTSEEPLAQRYERCEEPLRQAVLAALLARRDEAASALARADGEPNERAIASALVWISAGDAARALAAAERAPNDPFARALAAEALRELERPSTARVLVDGVDHPYAHFIAAQLADTPRESYERLRELSASGLLGARIRRMRAQAWLARDLDDPTPARDELSAAVWSLVRLGAPDELGRCYLLMSEVEAASGGDSAAAWLARAHRVLSRTGTNADLERLRRAFRRYGRRAIDRLVDADLERLLEGVRREHARARDLLSAGADIRAVRGDATTVEGELASVLASLGERQERLIASLEGVLVDKERTGQLVTVCRAIFVLESPDELDRELPRLALGLGGESAGLHRQDGALRLVSAHGAPFPSDPELTRALESALRTGAVENVEIGNRKLAVLPIGKERVLSILRGDARVGRVTDDTERMAILASVTSAAYERAHNAAALREAAARDAATLDSIHEGIVTLDDAGRVRSINGAAASLLGLARHEVEGRRLADLPGLGALGEAVAREVEDESIALAKVDVLVRARHYEGGVVATLSELAKAQKLAQKLVGSAARFTFEELVGSHPEFLEAINAARRVAPTDLPVLITGESGTGKELLAQAIHNASPRANHPFVGVNVAAIPRELLESELFGYEGGAFTGARSRGHPGRFELADRGTLLLDEIGDMPYEMQAKLLRVLQERVLVRLGGTREIPVRARLIATTHRDLEQAVKDGSFRLDLYYRMRVVSLRLPALRERRSDVRPLVEHQLAMHARTSGREPLRVAPHVMADLEKYEWPGNVRELANLMEGMASLLPPEQREITETPSLLRRALDKGVSAAPSAPRVSTELERLTELERRAIAHALTTCEGNVARAARALGIARGTLYNKMVRYGLRM